MLDPNEPSKFSSRSIVAICRECKPTIEAFMKEIDRLEGTCGDLRRATESAYEETKQTRASRDATNNEAWRWESRCRRMALVLAHMAGDERWGQLTEHVLTSVGQRLEPGQQPAPPSWGDREPQPPLDWPALIDKLMALLRQDMEAALAQNLAKKEPTNA